MPLSSASLQTATALIGLTLSALAAQGQTQAPAQAGLGRCAGPAGDGLPEDCTLDAPPLTLGFDYTPATEDGRRGRMTLTQSTPEGGTRDVTGPFDMAGALQPPALRDIDSDGIPDLLVQSRPAAFDVWLLNAEGFYRPAGRIRAQSLDQIEDRGALIVGEVRDGRGVITETAYLVDDSEVVTVFRLRIDPETRTCTLLDDPAAGEEWLNTDVLLAECDARDWTN